MKKGIKHENKDFFVMPSNIFGYYGRYKLPGTQKLWAITHETSIKHKKDEGLVVTTKNEMSLEAQNYRLYLMKTSTKRKIDEFLVIPLKNVNHPSTPQLWAIAHQNIHKTRKRRVFDHGLKHISSSNGHCKSP